jgi:ATP-dependent helicase/nuclease subunit A
MSAPRIAPTAHPLADAEARERIVRDRTRSLSIDAGAGTGKTRLLVERVLERVAQGGDLRRLAIITFTRKAASELQRRIRTELAKRAGERRFEEALAQLEQAPIGTTDSFCRGLLADVALEAGVSPGFAVADEVAASAIRDTAWSRLLARSTPAHEDLAARLREAAVHLRDVRRVAEAVLDHRDLVIPHFDAPVPEPLLPACRAACEELERVARWCTDPNDYLLVRIRAAIAAVHQASSLPPREGDTFFLELRGKKFGSKSLGKKERWGGTARKEEAMNALERLDSLAESFVKARSTHLAAQAIAWIREYADEVAAAKRERAVLDFRDLALVTRDLLRSNERLLRSPADRDRLPSRRGSPRPGRPHRLATRSGQAPSRRRPEAVDLPFPACGHRALRARAGRSRRTWRRRNDRHELPVPARDSRIRERGLLSMDGAAARSGNPGALHSARSGSRSRRGSD